MRRRKLPQPGQAEMNFFDVPSAPREDCGGLDIASAVRDMLSDMLSAATALGMDRHDIGTQISRLSGRDMTKNMLDQYCAPSAEPKRFPLEALPALTVATGDYRLLEMIAEQCGCRVARGEEALLAEIGALTLQERSVKARLGDLRKNVPDAVMERLIGEVIKRLGSKS